MKQKLKNIILLPILGVVFLIAKVCTSIYALTLRVRVSYYKWKVRRINRKLGKFNLQLDEERASEDKQ